MPIYLTKSIPNSPWTNHTVINLKTSVHKSNHRLTDRVTVTKKKIKKRQRMANERKAADAMMDMLGSNRISRSAKLRTYSTMIHSVVLNKQVAKRLSRWERKILKKIWGRRTNKGLMHTYNKSVATQVIRAQRVRRLGHVVSMKAVTEDIRKAGKWMRKFKPRNHGPTRPMR